MKKIIALILAILMSLSVLPVMAAREIPLDFLVMDATSMGNVEFEAKSSYEFKLNKPLEILDVVNAMLREESVIMPFDVKNMVESIFFRKGNMLIKEKISEGGEKISAYVYAGSIQPVTVNKNLSAEIDTSFEVWSNTDASNEKMEIIIDSPIDASRYLYCNEEFFKETGIDITSAMYSENNAEKNKEYKKAVIASARSNAVISGDKSKVKLVFSDIGLKKFILDVVMASMEIYGGTTAEMITEETKATIISVISSVRMFGNEALVLNYSLDGKGRVKKSDYKLNVAVNLYDVLTLANICPVEITKENSNIDFSAFGKTEYSYKTVKINTPVITDENSVNLLDVVNPYENEYEYAETETETEYYWPWATVSHESDNFEFNGKKYVPLRELFEAYEYEVGYDNGVIRATNDSKFAEYAWVELTMNSVNVKTSTGEFKMAEPVINIDGKTYVTLKDSELLMNAYVDYISFNLLDNIINIDYTRNKTEEDFN